jgi:hypothetical protein
MRISQEILDSSIPRLDLIDDGIDLNAIARRQQYPFPHPLVRTETGQGFSHPALRDRKFLADFDRGGLVAQPDNDNVHITTPVRDS